MLCANSFHKLQINLFPREIGVIPSEMAVCRCLFVNRAAKVKLFNDCGGTEIETCKQHLFKLCIGHCSRSESVNTDGDGFCNADSIGKLNFAAFCIALCNDILCRITCRIGSGPVNLCGILSGEAAAADVGIAGGKGEGLVFRRGKILYKVPEDKLVDALMNEIEKL